MYESKFSVEYYEWYITQTMHALALYPVNTQLKNRREEIPSKLLFLFLKYFTNQSPQFSLSALLPVSVSGCDRRMARCPPDIAV